MDRKRVIWAVTGTRADYGLMRSTFTCIRNTPGMKLKLIVTGMHLMNEFGLTKNEITKDGFLGEDIIEIGAVYEKDTKSSMAIFLGKLVEKLSEEASEAEARGEKPDFILLLGDRAEMLAGAIVGTYLSIPVVHVHGGDISGHVDNPVRHAITKLSHIHFPVTEKSAKRIMAMGEEPWRIKNFGAPQLDDITDAIENKKIPERKSLFMELGLDPEKKLILVIQHPVLTEFSDSQIQIQGTMEAVKDICEKNSMQAVVVYPNADAGGRKMIDVIKKYECCSIRGFKSLPRKDYISVMNYSEIMAGNSSSGIIESPSFSLPAVDIGTRQAGRERDCNVINSSYGKKSVMASMQKAMAKKGKIKCKNIYGKGRTGEKIAHELARIKIERKLLEKKSVY